MMPNKILFVGMTPNPGGLETYMINIFSALQHKGFSFDFINVFNKDIAYASYIRNNGGHIYRISFRSGLSKYFTRYHLVKRFFKHHHNYNVVHINALSVNEVYWAKAAKRYGIKHVIIQSHNSNIFYKSKIIRFLGNLLAKYNKIYLLNHSYITKLAVSFNSGRWMFGKHSKFKVMCNGINVPAFLYYNQDKILVRKRLGLNNSDLVVITTSRLSIQKNYRKIINVFKIMHSINHHCKLIIIGTGPELSMVNKLISQYDLSKSVIYLGKQKKYDIPKFLHSADLMLMPSLFEGYPYSLLEAQAAGVPGLVSRKVIPKESNVTGEVYYLSLNEADSHWAHKALKIMNKHIDKRRMNKLVNNSNYNMNNSISQIKSVYIHLLYN